MSWELHHLRSIIHCKAASSTSDSEARKTQRCNTTKGIYTIFQCLCWCLGRCWLFLLSSLTSILFEESVAGTRREHLFQRLFVEHMIMVSERKKGGHQYRDLAWHTGFLLIVFALKTIAARLVVSLQLAKVYMMAAWASSWVSHSQLL